MVQYVTCDFSRQKYLRWTVYLYITYIKKLKYSRYRPQLWPRGWVEV